MIVSPINFHHCRRFYVLTENNKIKKKNRKGKYVLLNVGFGGGFGVKCQGFKKNFKLID